MKITIRNEDDIKFKAAEVTEANGKKTIVIRSSDASFEVEKDGSLQIVPVDIDYDQ